MDSAAFVVWIVSSVGSYNFCDMDRQFFGLVLLQWNEYSWTLVPMVWISILCTLEAIRVMGRQLVGPVLLLGCEQSVLWIRVT